VNDAENSDRNSDRAVIGRPFKPGQSGNPGGRPRRDREVSEIFDVATPGTLRILWEMAQQRDIAALQTIARLSIAPPKASTVRVDIGPIGTAPDCMVALGRITQAIASGELDPVQAVPLISAIEQARRTIETTDQETRLRALEDDAMPGRAR
jgi:selenophosphate synthase